MRRPRDIDSQLKALDQKSRDLRARKLVQLGELVMACKADALPVDMLAGALLEAAASNDAAKREAWRAGGAGFFQGGPKIGRDASAARRRVAPADGTASPAASATGAS